MASLSYILSSLQTEAVSFKGENDDFLNSFQSGAKIQDEVGERLHLVQTGAEIQTDVREIRDLFPGDAKLQDEVGERRHFVQTGARIQDEVDERHHLIPKFGKLVQHEVGERHHLVQKGAEAQDIIDKGPAIFFFSNLATKIGVDMLANGAGIGVHRELLSQSYGKPLDRINEIFPHILKFLTLTGKAGGPKINLARGIWIHKSVELQPAFKDVIQRVYSPDFHPFGNSVTELVEDLMREVNKLIREWFVQFEHGLSNPSSFSQENHLNTEFINAEALKREVFEWVQEKTSDLIKDPLGKDTNADTTHTRLIIQDDTRLIMPIALDFEGEWFEPFEDAGVKEFRCLNGQVRNLSFMTTNRKQYVQQFGTYKLLSVPFKQHEASRFSMLFYLPDRVQDTLRLLEYIGTEEAVIQKIYFPKEQVAVGNFLIPKFELNHLGPLPFMKRYNLEYMEKSSSLIAQGAKLSGFLKINERGTRAAGVSTFFIDKKPLETESQSPNISSMPTAEPSKTEPSMPDKDSSPTTKPSKTVPSSDVKLDFVANRPFIFFIRDNQFGRMLFTGALINPIV